MARIISVFVASPGDVPLERQHVHDVAAALNRNTAAERGVIFKVLDYKNDARPRVHPEGPQGPIDEDMPVAKCDIVVGIFSKRLGSGGTVHELLTAIAARKPEVVICFNNKPDPPANRDEAQQAAKIWDFRERPEITGLELTYDGPTDFRDKIRDYLEKYLIAHHRTVPGKSPDPIHRDPSRYIDALREETSHFDVQGLRFGDNRAYRFSIEEFYIPLSTSSGAATESNKQRVMSSRPVPLQEALLAHRKLFVVGDPGSGKSTFLKRVAFDACKEWKRGDPLPIRIEVDPLTTFIAQQHRKTGPADASSPEWIPLFLGAHCDQWNRGLTADDFRARLKTGGCYVLIDGLDETPDEASRERMAKLIREAAAAFDRCRFVVTSRPEGKVPIHGFEEVMIADLEPEAIREFLAKVAKQLYPEDEPRERKFRDDLESAVNGRREIRKMTRNPVMLTALAVLQHNNVKLPEKRVDLYGSIVEWLSKKREKPNRMPAQDCLLRLRALALEMQNHPEGRRKRAPLEWAADKLATQFAGRDAAERFLRAEQADSGIVVSRGRDIEFWHLTFQEYLAAAEINGLVDADQHKLLLAADSKIYKPEWRETVLLYGGLLYKVGPPRVEALLRQLLDRMEREPTLANRAKCVGLIGALLPDLLGYMVSDPRYAEALRLVMDIFDAEKSASVPFKDRLAAAEALGLAGDPRLVKHDWVTIPETKNYWIGAQKTDPQGRNYDPETWDGEELRKVNLPAFRIGKYPVTVAQYLAFVEDGTAPDREPGRWEKQQEHPNWPVVNVTWHQATAYAEWVGGGARLPSEEEWERAARGPNCTKYPWGNADIEPTRANYKESNIGHPTPVGLYPSGVSSEGALDLIGNVLEWTLSKWVPDSGDYVWRGGSFLLNRRGARSSSRFFSLSVERDVNLGFRLAGGRGTGARRLLPEFRRGIGGSARIRFRAAVPARASASNKNRSWSWARLAARTALFNLARKKRERLEDLLP